MKKPTTDTTGTAENTPKQKSKLQLAEDYLNLFYKFRFNIIKHKPEFLDFNTNLNKWFVLDEYKLLSLKRELDNAGISITKQNLSEILFSDFSTKINPVLDYFENLPEFLDEEDYILKLCNCVKVKNSNEWYLYFKKWLTAVIANVYITDYCANHTMLVLTGEQGKFKTTFLEYLCPTELKQYNYTGKLNLDSKDSLTLISEYLFINIDDQLKQLHKKDENELKNLITINSVKYRRPYDKLINEYPHLCSFMASVNGNEFLTDTTGSRRFLPFEVENINIEAVKKIDISKVWSQAKNLFKNGFRYWFVEDEIKELNKRNEDFNIISIEEELILNYYRNKPVSINESLTPEQIKFLTPSMILIDLEIKTRQKLNKKKLGEALIKLNFLKKQRTIDNRVQWCYQIIIKSIEAIEKENNFIQQKEIF
jgi:predicted P-loop ATPase